MTLPPSSPLPRLRPSINSINSATHTSNHAAVKSAKVPPPVMTTSPAEMRSASLGLATFSPVNEKGCFEFDRVIKAGEVMKRGRKTKNYKPVHLVLRPLSLSIYADKEHTALRHNISIADISAASRRRKTRRPRLGLFTVFTPARNFYLDARSESEADQWVHQIRISARIDEWESGLGTSEEEAEASEGAQAVPPVTAPRKIPATRAASASHPSGMAYGTSVGSFSSISSLGAANFPGSSVSLSIPPPTADTIRPPPVRTTSAAEMDQERVLKSGKLFLIKSKGGVKKWKPVWGVLRRTGLAIYPNSEEYSPLLIIPFNTISNAIEIDSPSRNKKRQFCMQIITEERNWRLCAQDEDDLSRWLGTLKSMLVKRRAAEPPTMSGANTSG